MMRGGGSRVEGIWEITERSFEKYGNLLQKKYMKINT